MMKQWYIPFYSFIKCSNLKSLYLEVNEGEGQKVRKGILVILGVLFIISILQLTEIFSAVTAFASGLPWWVYFVLAGIIYSGYKSMTLTVEDRKVDQIHIEEEGKVYVKRMEDERERRKKARVSGQ